MNKESIDNTINVLSNSTKKANLIRKAFGPADLSRDGSDIVIQCPSCRSQQKTKRKLSIRLNDGVFHCWVCGLKGHNIEFLFRKYAPSHLEDARSLKFSSNEVIHLDRESEPDSQSELQIPPGFTLLGLSLRSQDPDIRDTINYCHSRGLSNSDLWYFKLGTCKSGSFKRRVIFPSFDSEGALNYYTARSIDSVKTMKYINAKVAKKDIIFNEININWSNELNLVEGPFDLTKAKGNSTCLLGSHLSLDSALCRKIISNRTPVLLALDPDARKKSHNIAKLLSSYNISVRTVEVPSDRDVGDMTQKDFITLVKSARPWSDNDRLLHMISRIKSGSII